MSLVFEDTEELFWYPQAVLILGTVTYWAPYRTGASCWGFSGEEVTWKLPGLFCLILFFFPGLSSFRIWRIDCPQWHAVCFWKWGMLIQTPVFISSFWEEEGSLEVVTGSNKVGFDSWQGELEILICFLVGKGTSYRTAAKLLCLLWTRPERRL